MALLFRSIVVWASRLSGPLAPSILFASAAQLLFAQGGPPMLTDDPDTPGPGRWEINTAYTEQRTQDHLQRSFPHVDANYGLGDRIQLKYETGYVFSDGPEGGVQSGWDNSLLGVKWRFLDESDAGFNMSVYPQLQLQNSSASVAHGLAKSAPNLLLPFEVSRKFGRFGLVGELGYQFLRQEQTQWVYGILGAVNASEDLELLSELRVFGETLGRPQDVILNIGLRKELGSRFKLLASMGTGLTNGPNSTSFIAYLGIQLLLGKEKP
jgi:hypothetical protein